MINSRELTRRTDRLYAWLNRYMPAAWEIQMATYRPWLYVTGITKYDKIKTY